MTQTETHTQAQTRIHGSAVKTFATTPTTARIGGYGVLFGGNDLQGETFDQDTDFKLDWYPQPLVFYDHTLQEPQEELGRVVSVRKDAYGLFIEAELDRSKRYTNAVLELIAQGVVGYSTGSSGHLVRRQGAKITRWPIIEVSLTTQPADPRTMGVHPLQSSGEHNSKSSSNNKGGCITMTMGNGTQGFEQEEISTMGTAGAAGATEPADITHAHAKVEQPQPDNQHVHALLERIGELETVVKSLREAPAERSGGYAVGQASDERSRTAFKALKAFDFYVRTGDRSALKAGLGEYDSSGSATLAEGGYLVPREYSTELAAALKANSIVRQAGARVITSGTNSFRVPTMTHSTAAVLTNEEASFSQVEPSFGEKEFVPYKATKLVKVSDELLSDSRIDILRQVLIPDFMQAFAAFENNYFTVGTGSGQPEGIINGATAYDIDTHTDPTADNIIDLYHQLPYLYRQNAVWMMHDTVMSKIRKLTSGLTGEYLWQPGMQAGQPDRLLGRPVFTNNSMASTTTDGSKIILFGDMRYFYVVDFGMESLVRLNELYAETGQVGFRMYKRVDSGVILADAFRVLQV